jgi:uncharacterized membrane protein YfcA
MLTMTSYLLWARSRGLLEWPAFWKQEIGVLVGGLIGTLVGVMFLRRWLRKRREIRDYERTLDALTSR